MRNYRTYFLLTLLGMGILFSNQALAQGGIFDEGKKGIHIDSSKVLNRARETGPVSREVLQSTGWVHVQTNVQHYNRYGEDGPEYQELEEYKFVYYLKPDGNFEIDAILDTDGTWTYDDKARRLILISNFRDHLNKDCIVYQPEKGKLIWYENYREDADNVMFFEYIFEAEH